MSRDHRENSFNKFKVLVKSGFVKGIACFYLLILVVACQSTPTMDDPLPSPDEYILITSTVSPSQYATPIPTISATRTVVPSSTPMDVPATQDTATSAPSYITLLFTGVIVPARCVQAAIDERGDAQYMFDEVDDLISTADLAVGTLNTTLSDASQHTGCIFTYVLTSDSRSGAAMAATGFDLMSVATNHIMNCAGASCAGDGMQAFRDTLDVLHSNGILTVGAGMNHDEAMQPIVVDVQGVRFGFVSLGMIEAQVFADENKPGIAVLNEDNLREAIANASAMADVVIAMPHWGPEDSPNPNPDQLYYARVAVEAGADLVVGNHTHVVQAIEQIDGVDVFYGLGNFIFDQTWDVAHQQGVILLVHFEGLRYLGYELIPTHVDGDGTVHIAGAAEAGEILDRIQEASELIH